MSSGYITPTRERILLALRASPGAKRSSIEGLIDRRLYGESVLKLKVAAPPTAGRANSEAVCFLAGQLGTPRSNVKVVRGASGRDKTVLILGLGEEEVMKTLPAHSR